VRTRIIVYSRRSLRLVESFSALHLLNDPSVTGAAHLEPGRRRKGGVEPFELIVPKATGPNGSTTAHYFARFSV